MNKTIKYGLFLLVLGIIVGSLLVTVNAITAPIIEERALKDAQETISEIAPNVSDVKDVTTDYKKKDKNIKSIYQSGDDKYAIYIVVTAGYSSGEITTIVVFDTATKKIVNSKVTKAEKQTAGIGDQVLTYDFKTAGKNAQDYADVNFKEISKDNIISQYNAISGATVSSRAVLQGVQIAANHFVKEFGE